LVKLRLPKKVVIIVSGVTVLTGASGATAFFIGKDRILGPSAKELAGVECTDVIRVADMRRDRAPWLRKFVRVPPGTDGMTRVKTALRVATKLQETLPADLIEVAVLDETGPDKRAFMRGRAIGAEVILVKDTAKVPGITEPYTVRYYQGAASGTGMFYGEEASITSAEAEALLSKMKDPTDCTPPPGKEDAGDKKKEKKKEKKPEKKPEKPKEGEGHEGAAKEGEPPKKEEPKKEEKPEVVFPNDVFGKMQKAAFDKAEAHAQADEEAKKEAEVKEPGMFGKMLGMVGLGGSKEEAGGEHGAPDEGGDHAAPAEQGNGGEHGAPAEESGANHAPAKTKPSAGHETKAEGEPATKSEQGKSDTSKAEKPAHEGSAPAAEEASGGFMSKMMGMVGLGKAKPKDIIEHSGGPAIASGKTVIKDEAGHGAATEPAASAEHGGEPAANHGDAPAAEAHGADAATSTGEDHAPPADHGPATDHATPQAEGEVKPKAEGADHAASAEHGAGASANDAAGHEKPAAEGASAHDAAADHSVNAGKHAPAAAEGEHQAEEPKKADHAPAAHGG
jgi:hypothetical protein